MNVHDCAYVCVMYATATYGQVGEYGSVSGGKTSRWSLLGVPACPMHISDAAVSLLCREY